MGTISDKEKNALLEQLGCGVAKLRFRGLQVEILYANHRFYDEFYGEKDHGIFFGEENYYKYLYNPIYENKMVPEEVTFVYQFMQEGQNKTVHVDGIFVRQEGDAYEYTFSFTDVTAVMQLPLEEKTDKTKEESGKPEDTTGIDKGTGLWNKNAFPKLVNRYISRGREKDDAFVSISIEHFMAVNDRYGYKFGDAVLVEIVSFMKEIFQNGYILGRLAGVKFAILMTNVPHNRLDAMVQQFCASVRDIYVGEDHKIQLEAKVTVLNLSDDDTFMTLSERASWIFEHMDELRIENYVFEDEVDRMLQDFGRGGQYIHLDSDEMSKRLQNSGAGTSFREKQQKGSREEETHAHGDFLARMSHEIRTPMNAICGMTDLLLQNGLTGLNYEYARTIKMASDNLISIVNDILDISKIEAGKLEIIPVEYQLSKMVEKLSVFVTHRIEKKEIAFFTDIQTQIPRILYGDEKRISQIVLNLLTNAAKYTEKGFVKLSISAVPVEKENEIELMFAVKDSGIGIRREDVGKLFAEFQQVDTRRNRKVEGTGLGLAISRQLAGQLGGRITVESEYGRGSVFTLVVRQQVKDDRPCVELLHPADSRVLVYEPNKYYAQGLRTMFEQVQLPARIEQRREDFIDRLKNRTYTHVIFDYNKAFFELKEIIRQRPETMFVSMLDQNSFQPKETAYANHTYLHKPLTVFELEKVIDASTNKCLNNTKEGEEDKRLQQFIAPDLKVLLVDDNVVNLKVAQGLLSAYQCQIDTVTSGFEALERLMEHPVYDMLFIDHMMPEMDGVETLQLIRSRLGSYGKQVTAVSLTANVLKEAQELFASSGFQGFLAKPVELRLLHQLMNELVPEEKKVMITSEEQRKKLGSGISQKDLDRIAMKGVDVAAGLRCCGNRVEEYLKILRIVLTDGRNKVKLLQEYAENKEYKRYGIEAHAFKSVAAGIGAAKQAELAKKHEFAVKDNQYDIIDEEYKKLINSYLFLLHQIQRVLDKEGDRLHNNTQNRKQEIDEKQLRDKLEQTAEALAQFKRKHALSLLQELGQYQVEDTVSRTLVKVKECMELYEDEQAEQLLRELLDAGRNT